MRFIQTIIAAFIIVSISGCVNDTMNAFDDATFGIRNHFHAYSAWDDNKDRYDGIEHRSHFKRGFLDGYTAHAESGATCPPALPPRCYWSVFYADDEGKQKQVAWYNGYEHGLFAAEQEGIAESTKIYTPIEVAPLGQQKAEHQIVDEYGNPIPLEETPSKIPPSPIEQEPKPPQPLKRDYDSSIENDSEKTSTQQEIPQPKLVPIHLEEVGEEDQPVFQKPIKVNKENEVSSSEFGSSSSLNNYHPVTYPDNNAIDKIEKVNHLELNESIDSTPTKLPEGLCPLLPLIPDDDLFFEQSSNQSDLDSETVESDNWSDLTMKKSTLVPTGKSENFEKSESKNMSSDNDLSSLSPQFQPTINFSEYRTPGEPQAETLLLANSKKETKSEELRKLFEE